MGFAKMSAIFYDSEMYHIGDKSYTNIVGLSVSTRHRRMIKKRIKQMEKKLGKEYQKQKREKFNVDYNLAQETMPVVVNKREYKDPIINDISNMRKQAEVLSNENKKIIFTMLENLMDAYLAEKKKLNMKTTSGLVVSEDELYKLKWAITDELANIQEKLNSLIIKEQKEISIATDIEEIKNEMAKSLTNGEAVAMVLKKDRKDTL